MTLTKLSIKDNKSRWFNLLLYPDNPQHDLLIMELQTAKYKACGICHNMDCYEEDTEKHKVGELKKVHFHFIVKFDNPRYRSGVAKAFEIEERFIEPTKSIKGSSLYLLHYGDESKYQYSVDDLVGTLKGDVISQLNASDKPSETECYYMMRDFIRTCDKVVSFTAVFDYCADNGCYSFARRNIGVIRELVYEHNARFYNSK